MKASGLFLLVALCAQEYQVCLLSIPLQHIAKMDTHSRDAADENFASRNEEVTNIAERSSNVIKALQNPAEHQRSRNTEGNIAFSQLHNIQKRAPPIAGNYKGIMHYINTLKQWQTFDQNTGQSKIIVPNDFKDPVEFFSILSHLNYAIPEKYNVSFHLAGKTRKIEIGTAPHGTGQLCVYRQQVCKPPSYNKTIEKLLSNAKLTDQEIAQKLLKSLEHPTDNNAWDGFSKDQEDAALELIAITQIAESVPKLPYIVGTSGRAPKMAEFARQCLEAIVNDTNLTFIAVFGSEEKSLYPAVGTGGTKRARNANDNPCVNNIKVRKISK
ncbi:uncharacterized protein LOC122798916 [Protopterus annectens]|uniref:uncharacterized protein LOC122798916 n=1 Tax=Protopterus annectens TaxID=7888 RepID=UPI001CFBD0B1|nr:uncharacterized protein LOC122798916 [Protopterus annectens]XP_043923943.1 uncharacterized protein LOC122798916 [Protopterus annectens]